MSKAVGVIQARMGSSRFPSKMLAKLAGQPVIDWVTNRVLRAEELSAVVLATTRSELDDVLVRHVENRGVPVFRGSENDVLGRIFEAAALHSADAVVRICGDNPFIDPLEIDRLVKFFAASCVDYAFNHLNHLDSGYADGFGAEILSMDLLRKLANSAAKGEEREHLTLAVWSLEGKITIKAVPAPPELRYPRLRFDIDFESDLERLQEAAETVGILGDAASFVAHWLNSDSKQVS